MALVASGCFYAWHAAKGRAAMKRTGAGDLRPLVLGQAARGLVALIAGMAMGAALAYFS